MRAVREVEHPQERHGAQSGRLVASQSRVKAAPAELRLALRKEVERRPVAFDHLDDIHQHAIGRGQMLRFDEVQIVGRRMVLWKGPERAALKQADREVEAWGAELPLV